jgi:UDPglucose 6-dehydrogenase
MKVAILGSGVVGLAVGLGLSKLGNPVVFYDIDQTKVSQLVVAGLQATSNMEKAVEGTDVFFICVPTPLSDKKLDLHYIETVVTNLATYLKNSQGYHLVVVKSTVLPTTTQNFVIPLLEKISGKKVGQDLGVCVNPEFLTEINQTWTADSAAFSRGFFNEDRIVIGEYDTNQATY